MNAGLVASAGTSVSGWATTSTGGPHSGGDGIEHVQVEAVDLGRVGGQHHGDVIRGMPANAFCSASVVYGWVPS